MNTANSFKQRDVLTEFIKETHMSEQQEQIVNEQYLLAHGFIRIWGDEEHLPIGAGDIAFIGNHCYIEKDIHRQMFIVDIDIDEDEQRANWSVYVQEDAGCGFIEIPFPWSDLSVEFFESVYYGIRGHKPKQV